MSSKHLTKGKFCGTTKSPKPCAPLFDAILPLKSKDEELIEKIGPAEGVFAKCLFGSEQKSLEQWARELVEVLQPLENELALRGGKFFGGEHPNMVDYMLWPWGERASTIAIKYKEKLPLQDTQIPTLRKWRKTMLEDPVAAELYLGPEMFWKVAECKLKNTEPNYDLILNKILMV
ncbi:unnamed protein product [Ceutorhynchus assimilis]|uniref:GST C-terminal domain-containing protein n=1 Tax=Ceutorhynchus assimilis TaxID=467358 RepID=A0A9N9MGD3_9CUCU|nr:unnamed protein product [Ceutorhynchus assimilis]